MGNDFVKDLLKDYKKKNTFNVFVNKYYLATDELKSMSNLQKIVRIETNKNTYFSALTENNASIFATPNKDDFL
ncbi:TPA: hypothetical protein RTH03_001487 [Campylobacter jejuni]|nr:hypothetical protein [Campylobacter jejuni]HDZ5087286.1 hypothetical protein [Campylobacter jejuni]HDZ5090665.1 hypothetical protein [Campylobacter jejuni]HDZ5092407.1 hypothetical protein [Campylobacter jejuni]HDZ5097598.1 hypothetical protein [Campylobacter jejuni]